MNCNCEKAPEFPTPAFIPGPIEIPINYRAVTIPADQGDDTTNPPLNGAYRNVVLKYAANNHVYIYSSDGIPVMLVGGINFDDIANRPLYDGQPMTSDTDIPDLTDEVATLEAEIQALATDFSYKGSVADYEHLPNDAAVGDVYTTLDTGLIYVWDGSQWVALNRYPSVFVGTDGTNPGTEGLVPAPTVADASKVLSANGGWVDNDNFYDVKVSTRTDKTYRELKTAWEAGKVLRFGSTQGVFWFWQKGNGSSSTFPITFSTKKHYLYTLQGEVTYEGTGVPAVIMLELHMNSTASDWEDQPLRTATEPIANLKPADLDATTPDYKIPSITVLKNALAEKEPVTIVNAGAPTTSTAAVSVGQQYYDSTSSKLYYCSAITAQGTDPETYVYTWSSFGPNVVQTTGISQTDVMSQKATTEMLWRDPTTKKTIQYLTYKYPSSNQGNDNNNIYIGNNLTLRETASCTDSVIIGHNASNSGQGGRAVVVGNNGNAFGEDVVAIGYQPSTFGLSKQAGSVAVGSSIGSVSGGSVAIGSGSSSYGYTAPNVTGGASIAIGPNTVASARSSIALGIHASAANQGEVNIGITSVTDDYTAQRYGYNGSSYRTLSGVATPTNNHDATTKEYVDQNIPTTFTTNEWNALWA